MIVVTGSMRSGTSLWMQMLVASGLPYVGEPVPSHWCDQLRAQNPRGFYESELVAGVYYATNPHPTTGAFLSPSQTRRHAVKVFVPGLRKSDLAYLDRVIATVRPWRVVADSLGRMPASSERAPLDISPVLLWWSETYGLIRDIATRGYPAHVITYGRLLSDPRRELTEVFDWIGGGLDIDAAAACIETQLNRSRPDSVLEKDLAPHQLAIVDELYDRLERATPLDESFIAALNDLDHELRPAFVAVQRAIAVEALSQVSPLIQPAPDLP